MSLISTADQLSVYHPDPNSFNAVPLYSTGPLCVWIRSKVLLVKTRKRNMFRQVNHPCHAISKVQWQQLLSLFSWQHTEWRGIGDTLGWRELQSTIRTRKTTPFTSSSREGYSLLMTVAGSREQIPRYVNPDNGYFISNLTEHHEQASLSVEGQLSHLFKETCQEE